MVHYIKLNAGFIELEEPLNPDLYSNIGTTIEDYKNGFFVLLNDEQWQFHLDNPKASEASAYYLFTPQVKIPTEEELLADAKRLAVIKIENYSHSNNVDQFTVNGDVKGWLTPTERSNYLQSITSAELLGEESVEFFVGNNKFALDLQTARFMLAKIQRYADASYIVTTEHKIAVNGLTTIEDVENFDITAGYPEKLNFEIDV